MESQTSSLLDRKASGNKRQFLVLVLLIISPCLAAQEHIEIYQKGQAHFDEGRYAKALKQFEKAAESVEKNMGIENDQYVWMISMQAMVHEITGDLAPALEIRQSVLRIAEDVYGKPSGEYALSLLSLGSYYVSARQYVTAYKTRKEAHKMLVEYVDADSEHLINSLYLLGEVSFKVGEYKESNQCYLEALGIVNRTNQRVFLKGGILQSISSNYQFLGQFDKVDEYYKKAINEQNRLEDELGIYTNARAAIVSDYGALLIRQRRFSESKNALQKGLEITKRVSGDRSPNYARILGLLGEIEWRLNNYQKSIEIYNSAIDVARLNFADQSLDVYSLVANLAASYKSIGDYTAAERNYKWVITHSSPPYPSAVNNLANLYADLGNDKEALVYYSQLADEYKEEYVKKSRTYALLLHNRSRIYERQEEYEKSINDQNIANGLFLQLEGESSEYFIIGLNNLSQMYFKIGEIEKAEKTLYEALERARKYLRKSQPTYATILNNLAYQINKSEELSYERYEKVARFYEEALEYYKASLGTNHMDYLETAQNLASILEGQGKIEEASDLYWKSLVGIMNNMDALLLNMSELERSKFLQQIDNTMVNYRRFVIDEHEQVPELIDRLVIVQSKLKGILFRSSALANDFLSNVKDPEVLKTYTNWKEKNIQLAIYLQASEKERLNQNINETVIRREINELEKRLSTGVANRKVNAASVTQLKKSLKENEAIVDLMRVVLNTQEQDTTYAALIIKKTASPQLIIFKDGASIENEHVRNYRNTIKRREKDQESFAALWRPIDPFLKDVDRVFIAPDGVYHSINVETLMDPKTQLYVGDTHRITRINSISSVLNRRFDRKVKTRDLVLVGYPSYDLTIETTDQKNQITADLRGNERFLDRDGKIIPLPGTLNEVIAIENLAVKARVNTNVLTKEGATEEIVRKLNSPDILHIATHGFFLKTKSTRRLKNNIWAKQNINSLRENPMLKSGLLLAGAEIGVKGQISSNNDGILTAYEASFMDLSNTQLAVLSACETGLGELYNGEGVYGLQRAFQKAGAKAVLISLWTVSDEVTEKLMIYFYENLFDGKSTRDAFFTAKNKIKSEFPNPYDWGAFVLNQG